MDEVFPKPFEQGQMYTVDEGRTGVVGAPTFEATDDGEWYTLALCVCDPLPKTSLRRSTRHNAIRHLDSRCHIP